MVQCDVAAGALAIEIGVAIGHFAALGFEFPALAVQALARFHGPRPGGLVAAGSEGDEQSTPQRGDQAGAEVGRRRPLVAEPATAPVEGAHFEGLALAFDGPEGHVAQVDGDVGAGLLADEAPAALGEHPGCVGAERDGSDEIGPPGLAHRLLGRPGLGHHQVGLV